jgi:hypothetical protein
LTHLSKVKRQTLSLAARESKWKKDKRQSVVCRSGTMVEHPTYYPKIKDLSLNASKGSKREKMVKI